MSKRRRRGTRPSFPRSMMAAKVKVKLGVNKLAHSDLYQQKKLDQEIACWALEYHPICEPRLAVLQRISDFLMAVPTEHRVLVEQGGRNYKLFICWFTNERRQQVYFFVRMLQSTRSHTLEKSITYITRDRAWEVHKTKKITWASLMDVRATPVPNNAYTSAYSP